MSRPPSHESAARISWRLNAEFVLASARQPARRPALYLIDLNSSTDHACGPLSDTVLAAVEALLHDVCRRTGTALRLPHGQFLLLQTVTSSADARDKADHLAQALTCPLSDTGPWATADSIALSVTIGVAVGPAHRPGLTALFWAADAALYRAKIDGTNATEVVG